MGPIEHYLYRVAPLAQGGYISVHIKGYHGFPGWACSTYEQAAHFAAYWCPRTDVYLSQGGQQKPGPLKEGKYTPAADRVHTNIFCLKSLRMDVDAKQYSSIDEMDAAIETFYNTTAIPKPKLAIKSGSGGYHLYWPFDRLVTPEEWQPLADALAKAAVEAGLKLDTECTIDRTRILRIPGTKNYKDKNNPTNVEIYYDDGGEFTYDDLQQALSKWISLTASSEDVDDDVKNMQSGNTREFSPVDIEDVAKECPLIDRILKTGGANVTNPVWFLTGNLSLRTTDPRPTFHRLSSGYHSYSKSETDIEFDRLKKDNKPPAFCSTFAKHPECIECATCKHRNGGTTPLSFATPRTNGHAYIGGPLTDLPAGYYRRPLDGLVCTDGTDEKGNPRQIILFTFEIIPFSGRVEGGKQYGLVFRTKEGNEEKEIRVGAGPVHNANKAGELFGDQGLSFDFGKPQRKFFMAWIDKLRHSVINIPPIGWYFKNGEDGFAFNGKFISAKEELPARTADIDFKYGVAGSPDPWRALVPIIVTDDRPDLSCLVATGFAAPLLRFTGHSGVCIGGWSLDTGFGKTTALSLAQGVWGSTASMNGLEDTVNHLTDKLVKLRNVPLIHDEIKNVQQEQKFLQMAGIVTEGREKGRSRIDGSARPVREWETPISFAANRSMIAAAMENGGGSSATMVRILEFPCIRPHGTKVRFDEVDRLRQDLKFNYGHIGVEYAKCIGQHKNTAAAAVKLMEEHFIKKLGPPDDGSRFWYASSAALTVGSYLAGKLGLAPFDHNRICDYLMEVIQDLRSRKKQSPTDYSNPGSVINELGNFIVYHAPRIIITDAMPASAGRPKAIMVMNDAPNKWQREHPCIHVARTPIAKIRFADQTLTQWCSQFKKEKSALTAGIINTLGIKRANAVVGAGTRYATAIQLCWTIEIQGTALEKAFELGLQKHEDDEADTGT